MEKKWANPPICKCYEPIPEGTEVKKGRNLVVCIDGTSNQFGLKNSNVIELYSQIVESEEQLTYYNSGIGTYAKPSWKSWNYLKQVIENKIDLAIAWNFEKIVMSAYHWLSENYQDNDRIWLFGFSRGAYQVRTIAAMIEKVGLIRKGNQEQIPFAYELYMDQKSEVNTSKQRRSFLQRLHLRPQPPQPPQSSQSSEPAPKSLAGRFKETFSRKKVNLHFIGVWDTVSSIGVIRGKNLPLTEKIDHICFLRHGLALEECRVKFLPEYFGEESIGTNDVSPTPAKIVDPDSTDIPILLTKEEEETKREEIKLGETEFEEIEPEAYRKPVKVKEVWFPGTHSDIGGGNQLNADLKGGKTASFWMSLEAISCGLELKLNKFNWNWGALDDVQESLTGAWWLFEWLPFKRLTYRGEGNTTYRLHRGKGRKIRRDHKIHSSIAFCQKTGYTPKATFAAHPELEWNKIVGKGSPDNMDWAVGWKGVLEMDLFDFEMAKYVVGQFKSDPNNVLWPRHLRMMTLSPEGRNALIDAGAIDFLADTLLPEDTIKIAADDLTHPNVIAVFDSLPPNKSEGSRELTKKIVAKIIKLFDPTLEPDHQKTMTAMKNLATMLLNRKKFQEAEDLMQELLVLGPDNLDTIRVIRDFVVTLYTHKAFEGAERLEQEVMKHRKRLLGLDHQDTVQAMVELAVMLHCRKKYEEAEKLKREVLETRKRLVGPDHLDTIKAMRTLAVTLHESKQFEEAEKLKREVLETRKKLLGPDHLDTVEAMRSLSITLYGCKQFEEMEKLERDILETHKKVLGLHHLGTVEAMSSLAVTLHEHKQFEEAENLKRETLETYKKLLGPDHLDTVEAMRSLSVTLHSRKQFEEAERLKREVLEARKKVLGPDHLDTFEAMRTLAVTLHSRKQFEEAEKLFREALETRKKLHGPDHLDTVKEMRTLAVTLHSCKQFEEAEKLFREVLETRRKLLGPGHRDTIEAMMSLAVTLHSCKQFEEAEKLHREVLETRKKVLGPGHLDTIEAIHSLAVTLHERKQFEEAEKLNREVLETRKKVLGPDHLDTFEAMRCLAITLRDRKMFQEAEDLFRQVLEFRKNLLGPDHEDTLRGEMGLSILFRERKELQEAEELNRDVLERCKRVLGLDHPYTIIVMRDLAITLRERTNYQEAEDLMRHVLEFHKKNSGPDHPDTVQAVNDLATIINRTRGDGVFSKDAETGDS